MSVIEEMVMVTFISTYDLQGQSIKANQGQIKQSTRRDFILNKIIHTVKQYKRGLSCN